jgi:hypothetical protein
MNERIVEILRTGKVQKDLPRVVAALRELDEDDLFETLFPLSVKNQTVGTPVAFAAYALDQLNPKCRLTVRQAVEALLPTWDISIQEVVYYLSKQFGTRSLLEALKERASDVDGNTAVRLETMAYWASVYAKL